MADRELLELAAKGAGIELHPTTEGYPLWIKGKGIWDPLNDDADAFRLAVALGLTIAIRHGASVCAEGTGENFHEENWRDPGAATRRAIVRAAAFIGEQSPASTPSTAERKT